MNHQPNTPASLNEAVNCRRCKMLGRDLDAEGRPHCTYCGIAYPDGLIPPHEIAGMVEKLKGRSVTISDSPYPDIDRAIAWVYGVDLGQALASVEKAGQCRSCKGTGTHVNSPSDTGVCTDCLGTGIDALAAPGAAIDAREQEAPELLLGWKRYEKARKLSPFQWNRLHIRNLAGENFDAMIDSLPEPTTPVPTPSEALSPATVAQPVAYLHVWKKTGERHVRFEPVADTEFNRKNWQESPLYAAQPCASQGCGGADTQ